MATRFREEDLLQDGGWIRLRVVERDEPLGGLALLSRLIHQLGGPAPEEEAEYKLEYRRGYDGNWEEIPSVTWADKKTFSFAESIDVVTTSGTTLLNGDSIEVAFNLGHTDE